MSTAAETGRNVANGGGGDPRAPIFFLSYPRPKALDIPTTPPGHLNPLIPRLFTDLSNHVNELIPRRPGEDPGFLDVAMRGGTDWQESLLSAVGTCQVFVALIAPNYIDGSKWCPREWDAFTRRRTTARKASPIRGESPVVPVLWVPVEEDALPPEIAEINRFTPYDLPDGIEAYERNGLYGLLHLGYEDVYRAMVWKLAQHIQYMHATYRVDPWVPKDTRGLRNSFRRRRPRA